MSAECEAEIYDEFAALARFAFDRDGAAHHIHDVLGDGHTQAGTLNAADGGAFLPAERLKDVLLELFAHTNAIVLDAELIAATALGRTVLLGNADADRTACGSELDGVGQNVQQDLVQPGLIAVDILVGHIHRVHIKFQLFCVDLPADNGFQIVQHIRKVDFHLFQMELSAFDAAHIQHIVDE